MKLTQKVNIEELNRVKLNFLVMELKKL